MKTLAFPLLTLVAAVTAGAMFALGDLITGGCLLVAAVILLAHALDGAHRRAYVEVDDVLFLAFVGKRHG